MNATKMTTAIAMAALLMAAGCGGREGSPSPTAPSVLSDSSQTASGGGGGGCGSAKETLTGAAINGVTPSGEAVADMSKFCSGGSTSLSGGSGRLVTSLDHFAVSFDQVRVKNGDATILAGGSFR